ncbi:hypothetical protein HF086_011123 [Spodoptera exigua]|uniref:Transmembrane protein n=1 Tax=Spodoptera exigua TaxID=7107 RepID=A0A922MYQ6_SPOEX|nr:hypothetical protein HF086_011123 [Spodoptera exigua]
MKGLHLKLVGSYHHHRKCLLTSILGKHTKWRIKRSPVMLLRSKYMVNILIIIILISVLSILLPALL